jgi:UDPglucose 6-dehydrogenase
VLGLAFKGGTDDIRESPPLFLVGRLIQEGSNPRPWSSPRKLSFGITFASSAYEAAHGANALLILTE